ncbi:MAG: PilZ domain-containing protein [Desulfuromonadales bacterium]|nr:MAG: PilZ domain-containing protein [Desulfuromonadales bacterium]
MTQELSEYGKYFEELQRVNLMVRLGEAGSFDGSAAITSLKGDLAWLEIYGGELPPTGTVREGAEASVSVWTGGALCRCDAAVEKVRDDRQFQIRLSGRVRELQRREYFRLDVAVPFIYEFIPPLEPEEVQARWTASRTGLWHQPEIVPDGSGFKVLDWRGRDIPSFRANLSGGGMRIKVSELVEAGTLLEIILFLPHPQPRAVCAVAEVLRCQEITLSWERGTHYHLSVKFILIGDSDRESVISYLFSEQRRQLLMRNDRVSPGGSR